MDVTIHGLNMKVPETIDSYARKKLDRLDRYLPGIADLRLELSYENTRRGGELSIAQITVRHQRGAILRAEERATGVEVAINQAVDKMYRQIQRFKGKRTNHKARGRYAISAEELLQAEEIPGLDEAVAPELVEEGPIRHKQVSVTPMTEEEAIDQMELLGHTFFIFFNSGANGVNVVYKRHDGTYGVLQPQVE